MANARIMIVEDEGIVAEDIRISLQSLGHTVTGTVSSGEEAVERAGRDKPDLVLMDIMLGGVMNGVAAAAEIRSRYGIPVVYLTAYADEALLHKAKITKHFGYILKPYKDRELHSILEIALYNNKMEKQMLE